MKDISNLDLYGLFDIDIGASEKEILRAYRKKALKCHPDKNKDDPRAAEQFHELSQALEVLTDKAARCAYDKVIRARQAAKIRYRELDYKRRKLRDDLEARERDAAAGNQRRENDQEKLAKEIARLRREGSSLLETEKSRMKKELDHENDLLHNLAKKEDENKEADDPIRVKVKWRNNLRNKDSTEMTLKSIFKRYGPISHVLVSEKKNTAIIEYSSIERSGVLEEDGDQVRLEVKLLSGSVCVAGGNHSNTGLHDNAGLHGNAGLHSNAGNHGDIDAANSTPRYQPTSRNQDEHDSSKIPQNATHDANYVNGINNKKQNITEDQNDEVLPDNHEDLEMLIMKRMQQAHEKQQNL